MSKLLLQHPCKWTMRARRLKATSLLVFFPLPEWLFSWTSTATSPAAKKPTLGRKQTLSVCWVCSLAS
ncbi:hypothetical protein CY34DRAFT_811406 [Suillus luteus UH-Slu-Lm8-n1]|uniref:Uncharacterized protein n=1 Tax=Suillus luteus UH-Slu-Lm8-n1 TaxID=930992 RepID=A0A0D0API3_9AGAM|nr:hypothetical protein CY34DRAFT_811406 [Suillus luteus UH-Slu-Lm8-n1]